MAAVSVVVCRYAEQHAPGWGPCQGPVEQYLITLQHGVEADRVMVCQHHGVSVVAKLTVVNRLARARPMYELQSIAARCAYGACRNHRAADSTLCAEHDD